mgnify:CR=1 FL=1
MLSRLLKKPLRHFSTALSHQKNHSPLIMDSKFYENDFIPTSIEEIDYIRSPFYDLAKAKYMNNDDAHDLLDEIGLKAAMMDSTSHTILSAKVSPETQAFFRYQDKVDAPEDQKHVF